MTSLQNLKKSNRKPNALDLGQNSPLKRRNRKWSFPTILEGAVIDVLSDRAGLLSLTGTIGEDNLNQLKKLSGKGPEASNPQHPPQLRNLDIF